MSLLIKPGDVPRKRVYGPTEGKIPQVGAMFDENIISRSKESAAVNIAKRMKIMRQMYEPGGFHVPHQHMLTEQAYYVIQGSGRVRVGKDWYDVAAGSVLYIPPRTEHELINTGDETLVNLLICTDLDPEDIA